MKIEIKRPISCISGSMLKMLAMITMLIDHIAHFILSEIPFFTKVWFTFAGKNISFYYACRMIGRIAFPLFCFLLVEGFIHTSDRKKYAVRLLIFALLSELPWNFANSGSLLYSSQNVMFTLLFGYLALCAMEHLAADKFKQILVLAVIFVACTFLKIDYGVRGLGLILIIYLFREKPIPQAIVGSCMIPSGLVAGLAFIPINLYNGERGFMRGKIAKYSAYIFYPLHILILGLIRYFAF